MKKTKKPIEKFTLSEEKKQHYRELHAWLKQHPEIVFKKLNPYGFSIDIRTVPKELVNEFIQISTLKE